MDKLKTVFSIMADCERKVDPILVHTFEQEDRAKLVLNWLKYTQPVTHFWIEELEAPADYKFKEYYPDEILVGTKPGSSEKIILCAENLDMLDDPEIRWESRKYEEFFEKVF